MMSSGNGNDFKGSIKRQEKRAPKQVPPCMLCLQVNEQILESPYPLSPLPRASSKENSMSVKEDQQKNSTSCICFNF
ncbi:hypothetical protein L6164_032354 [Bauhinia variegata]|uniref:Uncharacterized protein n=1 Tax=Bauhinia variegata TaxID=167791 RepID=A0ACB9KNK1_BAUVA|nr:hypothetical protein L6164_032354 [Bauhinia variegata]